MLSRLLNRMVIVGVLLRIRRVPLLLVLAAMAVVSVAAAPADSTDLAIKIASYALMVVVPFLGLAQLHLDGRQMVLISMAVALVIALVAQVSTHELTLDNLQGGTLPLLEEIGKCWAIQQAVFQLFKDSATLGPRLTDKPVLAAPQA